MMENGAFSFARDSSLFWGAGVGGGGGNIFSYSVQDSILDSWNEKLRPPLPPFQWWKMARLALRANSSLILGGEGGGGG